MAPTLMGSLCSHPVSQEDHLIYQRLVESLESNYPTDWKSWEVENLSYTDLFGRSISSKMEAKLRFAIPTAELTNIFSPDDFNLSETKYRSIKRKLLEWPLGRAILYAPHNVIERVHVKSYDQFMATVKVLKPSLTSRDVASSGSQRKRRSTSQESAVSGKIQRTATDDVQNTLFEKMIEVLSSQTKAIEDVSAKASYL